MNLLYVGSRSSRQLSSHTFKWIQGRTVYSVTCAPPLPPHGCLLLAVFSVIFLPNVETRSINLSLFVKEGLHLFYSVDDMELSRLNEEASRTIYKPLLPGQIRLIHIHPRATNVKKLSTKCGTESNDLASCAKPVACSLSHGVSALAASYQTLSYVWGDQTDPSEIVLDGVPFYVTKRLHEALESLRMAAKYRIIWIDALAINQSDVIERNQQVQMMSAKF